MTRRPRTRLAMALMLTTAVALPTAAQVAPPRNGTELLERMRARYAGRWYRTLTFTQTTTIAGPGGAPPTVQTWYESLAFRAPAGGILRIDVGRPADGNGVLYTADSMWRVRGGQVTAATGDGNPFIPLIENVYLQPVATTARQLAPLHIDLDRVTEARWQGRPAWVVGVAAVADSTTPQFWVDEERLVLVRMVVLLAPGRPPYDIHLDRLVATGGGWLATHVTMFAGGVARQTEDYAGWKTGVTLDPRLFDGATWNAATHWVRQP